MTRATRRVTPLAALLAAVTGCADGDRLADGDAGPIPTDLTDPAAVIESHARALERMDFAAYEALLEKPGGSADAGFRFFFREDDADGFLWVIGDSWDYDTECDMIRNMMDPEFVGGGPAVETIRMDARILHTEALEGRVELTVDADLQVVSPGGGWLANPRLVFTLVPDTDGFLRIRSVREWVAPVIAGATWGRIKAYYKGRGPEIPVDLVRPLDVIESHARTIDQGDLMAYAALLAPDFRYVVPPGERADIPWLEGDSWGIEDELHITANMMDPSYYGELAPVRVMRFGYTFVGAEVSEPEVVITVATNIVVLVSRHDGWFADTRIDFVLVRDTGGFYRIREIREEEPFLPEYDSWAVIKAGYR